jgi:hypothetical protein
MRLTKETLKTLRITGIFLMGFGVVGLATLALYHPAAPKPAPKPTVSIACQVAAGAQNNYAQLADQQGYLSTFTNAQVLTANEIDAALVGNMVKAGCPQTIRFFNMTTRQWDN